MQKDIKVNNPKCDSHEVIDFPRRIVAKRTQKKYKFHALQPIDVEKRIECANNSVFVQVTLTNVSAHNMFLIKAIFTIHSSLNFLKSVDLNEIDDLVESTVVLKPKEVRNLLY